ncbi:MAG: type II toxin-antitoxin system prevent-host-death family antitoxin [Acidobacteriota bacterium]|nr:type II toxin-antitoxin system prevent-host-death family antitoxin [Acidobacteriota bacterium]MDE2712031.1 type II toxin-antitoxin system prevent-host-death family antitoxin [Acidobacteriota bacterium]MXX86058.1 type II toxin-antitoxin system prevent-host-death family antitoxin [Acidobacteriota bacterium]MYF76423.1 type II toxin-antitoxin system prevent-host-death family antitoxin [Acidobacteriota bacterium]
MQSASISEARNAFSGLLQRVRLGETVLITDRGKPVARIEPCGPADSDDRQVAALLARRGVAAPPRAMLDLDSFLNAPRPRLRQGVRASDAVSADRDERR